MRARGIIAVLPVAALTLAACAHSRPPLPPERALSKPAVTRIGDVAVTPRGVVVDKVVAVVRSRPLTLSECELEVRIERAIAGGVVEAMEVVSDADMAQMLPELVDRAAVIRGLKSHYASLLDPALPEKELERLHKRFPTEAAWQAFLARIELSDEEVEERLRARLEKQAILIAKLYDLIRVKRREVDDYIAQHPGATREMAETQIARTAADEKMPGILADARRATGARIIDPIVSVPEPGAKAEAPVTPESAGTPGTGPRPEPTATPAPGAH